MTRPNKKKRKPATKKSEWVVTTKQVLSVTELAHQIRRDRNWDAAQKAKLEAQKINECHDIAYYLLLPFEKELSIKFARFFELRVGINKSVELLHPKTFPFQKRKPVIKIKTQPNGWWVSWRRPDSKREMACGFTADCGREMLKEHIAEVMSHWII